MGLGRERRDQRSPGATSRHIITKRCRGLLIDHKATFAPPSKNVFQILRPFSRHHPINFSSAEITAKVITNVSRLETMANNAVGRSTPAQSKKNIELVLHLLSHLQIDNMGDDLFAMMA